MTVQRPFDPVPLLADHLHAKLCPGHVTDIAPVDCLIVVAALGDFVAELRAAGLALVPLDGVHLLERLFADATTPEPLEELPPADQTASRARAYAPTWVRLRYCDGRIRRDGPHERWLAELLLNDLGFAHEPDLVAARLEGEPDWVEGLLRELDQEAA